MCRLNGRPMQRCVLPERVVQGVNAASCVAKWCPKTSVQRYVSLMVSKTSVQRYVSLMASKTSV